MNTCQVLNIATLQPSDHICVWDNKCLPFRYTHHGVVYEQGKDAESIVIAHVWSPIEGFRQAQADSSFRLTSLADFMGPRPLSDLRRVQYNSSVVGDALSHLGETHRAKSDIPPVVLARCKFLLGLGKGHFNIVSLNCEHVALWCKTGVVWSKQLFNRVHAKIPYVLPEKAKELLTSLEETLQSIRESAEARNERLVLLDGKRVYVRLARTKFLKRLGDKQRVYVVHNDPSEADPAFRYAPTSFKLKVDVASYNCVQVQLEDFETGEVLCAKSNCIKLVKPRSFHPSRIFQFEFGWYGELQSCRNRRWYVGGQKRDGLLRTYNTRDNASTFEIVDADELDEESVPVAFGPEDDESASAEMGPEDG